MVNSTSTIPFELIKCDNCEKTLGHIRIDVKMFPSKTWTRLVAGGPLTKIEKDVLCEKCFEQFKRADKLNQR